MAAAAAAASAGGKNGSSSRRAKVEHLLRGLVPGLVDPNRLLNGLAVLRGYLSVVGTIIAYLAFTWSTVVLLGGYVTSLQKKDFWCLTVISLLEATRLFNDLESEAKPFDNISLYLVEMRRLLFPSKFASQPEKEDEKDMSSSQLYMVSSKFAAQPEKEDEKKLSSLMQLALADLFEVIIIWPVVGMILFLLILKEISPVLFFVIPCWRLHHHDYGVSGGDNGQASLRPALDIFYILVLVQGILAFYISASWIMGINIFTLLQGRCNFPNEWAQKALRRYLRDTAEKCKRDPASIQDMNLFRHASALVGSDSWEDYNDGLKVVAALVKQRFKGSGKYILPCRPKVQKLIDTLGFRSSDDEDVRHMREFAATIVADFAKDLHLINFPGAIRCISSLLETTHKGVGVASNELILQGLKILEKLAFDHLNCEVICRDSGLLSKIMEPIYSNTLIQEIMAPPRASVVKGSFKVVHRLIRTPGETGAALRYKISSSKQAVSNLERILQDATADNQEVQRILEDDKILQKRNRIPKDCKIMDSQKRKRTLLVSRQELKILAREILTELALDSSTNLSTDTVGSFIMNQLQIFLADEDKQEPVTELISECPLKTASGKTLALLSKTKDNSLCIISKCGDIFYRLIQKFDDSSMIHRTTAAEILENLCTHHTLEEECVKETLLPKVLGAILTGESKLKIEEAQRRTYAPGDDEENQNGKIKQGDEEQTDRSLQEALLSLLLRINNLIGADSVALVVRDKAPGEGAFVSYLKTTVEENYEDITPTSLRIVKLCGQIAMSMVQHNLYTAHFKKQKFVQSLSKASDIMSELESCMLVTGTNFPMKPVRPLLSAIVSDLEKRLTEVSICP
ncbi:uncharacterized protein C2845_PM17G04110 [Panicum miliaceum]|uniref:Uncharacterized protein n=1 Tax=Panicum miliaceum TaxID=4540 RepID=A0A3L6Q2G6_PANMI|nr:uncharacterized protein C2845_PM17G04110 [Panicum miliaceum]